MSVEELKKGDDLWLQLSLERVVWDKNKTGLQVWVKADPRLEQFIADMGQGGADPLESYGQNWIAADSNEKLWVYQMASCPDKLSYNLTYVGNTFDVVGLKKGGETVTNLSWLRLKGISGPTGVKFIMVGPISREYAKSIGPKLLNETSRMIKDYLTPFNVVMRISCQEI